jgi:hypothetical protein
MVISVEQHIEPGEIYQSLGHLMGHLVGKTESYSRRRVSFPAVNPLFYHALPG